MSSTYTLLAQTYTIYTPLCDIESERGKVRQYEPRLIARERDVMPCQGNIFSIFLVQIITI